MLTLKNGAFFRDGVRVPLEFGNKDQLKLIRAVELLKQDGAMPDYIFDESQNICGITIKCVCGMSVDAEWEKEEEERGMIEGKKVKCWGCNLKYIVCADEDNFLFFKLL